MASMNSSSARRKRVLGYRITFPSKEEGILYLSPRKSVKGAQSGPLWFRRAMNWDVSIGPLAHHLLIRSYQSLNCLLRTACFACALRCALLRSFVCPLAHFKAHEKTVFVHETDTSISYSFNPQCTFEGKRPEAFEMRTERSWLGKTRRGRKLAMG